MKIRCDECKELFTVGYQTDGLPNICGFELKDGRITNVCTNCIIALGRHDPKGLYKLLNRIKKVESEESEVE